MRGRYDNLDRVRGLDPRLDHQVIYRLMLCEEWPWEMKVGLGLAFSRSFSTSAVAEVLVGTGELLEHTRKRLDDTGLLMYEIVLDGFDGLRGQAAIRRINQIHRPFRHVAADEFLYVLACCAVVPLRWVARYGWRRPSEVERVATYEFYAELGRRLHVEGMPGSMAELESWFDDYDARHLTPSDNAARIERATRTQLPGFLKGALYDPRLRAAMKVPTPPFPVRVGLHAALKTRAFLIRFLGRPARRSRFADGIRTTTYPDGYTIEELGPRDT